MCGSIFSAIERARSVSSSGPRLPDKQRLAFESRVVRLQRELDQLSQEREQLEKRMQLVMKERSALQDKTMFLARENENLRMQVGARRGLPVSRMTGLIRSACVAL